MLAASIESVRAAASASDDLDVIVVDNGGAAEYADRLPANVIGTGANLGFGRAVNTAVRSARGDRVLLMNPDSVVHPDIFRALDSAWEEHPGAMFGALLIKEGAAQIHAYNIWWSSVELLLSKHRWISRLDRLRAAGAPAPVARLCGAGLYAARDDMLALGPFNESFFLYGEDVDLSIRSRIAGHSLILVPDAVIDHAAGTSSAGSSTLVARAQMDGHLRLLSIHRNRFASLSGRFEALFVSLVGLLFARSRSQRSARVARMREVRRWGFRRVAPRLDPTTAAL